MAAARDNDDIFVYDGTQPVPDGVRRARIHKSVKIVRARAFYKREHLIYVEFHDGVEIIEEEAFYNCPSFRGRIKLLGVRIIKKYAFSHCHRMTDVEFGDKLETVGASAFIYCYSLKKIKMPSVRTIGLRAFAYSKLSDVEFGEGLMTLHEGTFSCCSKLERIALPLKDNMIEDRVFFDCPKLTTVDVVGGIHQTISSLHTERWRNDLKDEINSINQVLPTIRGVNAYSDESEAKSRIIQWWMESATRKLNSYKAGHKFILKEATTLLELALWKANRDDNGEDRLEREGVRTLAEVENAMAGMRVTSGADVVIKNVLPFLALK